MEEDTLEEFMRFACECMARENFFGPEDQHTPGIPLVSKNVMGDLGNGDIMRYVRRDLYMNKPGHYEWVFISKRHRALVYRIVDWGFGDIKARWVMHGDYLFQFDAVLDEERHK